MTIKVFLQIHFKFYMLPVSYNCWTHQTCLITGLHSNLHVKQVHRSSLKHPKDKFECVNTSLDMEDKFECVNTSLDMEDKFECVNTSLDMEDKFECVNTSLDMVRSD